MATGSSLPCSDLTGSLRAFMRGWKNIGGRPLTKDAPTTGEVSAYSTSPFGSKSKLIVIKIGEADDAKLPKE